MMYTNKHTLKIRKYELNDILQFGKHKGVTVKQVWKLEEGASYIAFCEKELCVKFAKLDK